MLGNLFTTKTVPVNGSVVPPPSIAPPTPAPLSPVAQQPPLQVPPLQPASPVPAQPAQPMSEQSVVGSSMQPSLRHDLSVLTHLDTRTTQVVQQAEKEAQRLQLQVMSAEQLLYGLLCDAQIFDLMQTISADAATIAQKLQQSEKPGNYTAGQPTLSEDALQLIEKAYAQAKTEMLNLLPPKIYS
jgi:hypothetical protein